MGEKCGHWMPRVKEPCNRRKGHPGRHQSARGMRSSNLKANYGITLAELEALIAFQGDVCAICRARFYVKPVLDHSHKTGEPRGAVCTRCNMLISRYEGTGYNRMSDKRPWPDDVLASIAAYLTDTPWQRYQRSERNARHSYLLAMPGLFMCSSCSTRRHKKAPQRDGVRGFPVREPKVCARPEVQSSAHT